MYKLMQKISITCIGIITTILLLDYHYSLLSINTIFALLYVIVIFFASIWSTFLFLQNVLGTNTPYKAQANKLITILHAPFKGVEILLAPKQVTPIDERIQNFVGDIEAVCIRKWYTNYISDDEQFLQESTKLIDIVVRRFLQIAGQINSDKVLHGTITILLRHVKEYRKAVKKASVDGSVEGHYRYAHVGSKSARSFEHFVLQITSKTLRNFVHWELYNSLACRSLNAILARKLVSHMVHCLSAPGFINYKILLLVDERDEYLRYQYVSIGDVDHSKVIRSEACEKPKRNDHLGVINEDCEEPSEETQDILHHADDEVIQPNVHREEAKDEKVASVRVYESRSSNKTWRNSSDLDCISLGQDILFLSNIVEEDAGKPPDWVHLAEEMKVAAKLQPVVTTATAALLPTIKPIVLVPTTTSSTVKDTMKDLQHTTSVAMHKIEDEAAGVVEGIFDFGMAGIRKGLRLTGLQDNVLEAPRTKSECKDIPRPNNQKTRLAKLSHVNSDEEDKLATMRMKKNKDFISLHDDEESFKIDEDGEDSSDVYMNPLVTLAANGVQGTSPSYEGDILLEKSPMIETRTSSNDSTTSIPTMSFLHVEDSPEPEYEDNPDLATTTAKLRSLLAQKTESNTPVASPMSLIPTPQDASGSSIDDLSEVDGALPSMYKAWAKTATGVFQNTLNTIKTALPGNAQEEGAFNGANGSSVLHSIVSGGKSLGNLYSDDQWTFVESEPKDNDLVHVLDKFLAERQAFCMVDNAFEAVEAIELSDHMDASFILNERKYEEELDDFDTKIPITKALVDLICELVEETYPPLVKENIVKTFLLTFGSLMEEKLQAFAGQLVKCICHNIGHLPKLDSPQVAMPMNMEELILPFAKALSSSLGQWLDDKSIKSILTLVMESVQSHKINVDTSLQLLELIVAEVITACNQSSPSYSV